MARILVVDTSATSRVMVIKTLEEHGHRVEEISSGKEALEICMTAPPDCVIMELVLQDVDGFKVLHKVRDKGLKIPILVLTDIRMHSVMERCLELGATAFLRKPVSPIALTKKLTEILGTKKSGEQT